MSDILELLLVLVGNVLQGLVCVTDPFKLLVESLAVTGNLAEVSLDAYELFSGPAFRVLDYVFRQPHLSCQFKCERVSRQSHLKLEHRRNVLHVEHHRAIHYTRLV